MENLRSKQKSVSLMPTHTEIVMNVASEKGMSFSRALQFILEDWPRLKEILNAQITTIKLLTAEPLN